MIKVNIDTGLPFAKRFEESTAEWDDGDDGYQIEDLAAGLQEMKTNVRPDHPLFHITTSEIDESLALLERL